MAPSNLSISPLKPEEAHLYQNIRHESFRDNINKILYTREPSAETQAKIIEKAKKDIAEGVLFMACWDTTNGEMIAGARWRYVGPKDENTNTDSANNTRPRDRTWEEVDAGLTVAEPYPESNPELFQGLFKLFNKHKREIMGTRPYYVLDTLVTHPDHHRRGAGGLLVQWGCDQADKKGVEAYLEASPMGKPLYERYGFKEVKTVQIDFAEYGAGDEKMDFIVSNILLLNVSKTKLTFELCS